MESSAAPATAGAPVATFHTRTTQLVAARGLIDVASRSLVEARQMVDDEVDDIPDDFVFVVNGVAILVSRSALFAAASFKAN
eukprot:SAG11_NODE_6743_length_1255_cov_5.435986_2_plen_82_part_00